MRELRTTEVANMLGIRPDLLRKWSARGFLKKAPKGRSGQGRSVENYWTPEAVEEVREFMKLDRNTATRYNRK